MTYALVAFDRDGIEAHDDEGVPTGGRSTSVRFARRLARRISDRIVAGDTVSDPQRTNAAGDQRRLLSLELARRLEEAHRSGTPFTHLLIASHGWLADYGHAVQTYGEWFAACEAVQGLEENAVAETFRPMIVAIHWPSMPNTARNEHAQDPIPFEDLATKPAIGNGTRGPRGSLFDLITSVAPLTSYYVMKRRSATVGRRGVAEMLTRLQKAGGPLLSVHMTGHSFGAKLAAATLSDGAHFGVRPIDSLFLIEGALSAWAFCPSERNPYGDPDGSAVTVLEKRMVRGPLVTTTSRFDFALGRMFPAAQFIELTLRRMRRLRFPVVRQRVRESGNVPPRIGALGIWSLAQQPDLHRILLTRGEPPRYTFRKGNVYHLVADAVVNLQPYQGVSFTNPLSGSHSNIAHPELASVFWQMLHATPTSVK